MQTLKNIFSDVHTWVVIAAVIAGALTSAMGYLPADWNVYLSGVLGVIAIFIKQNN